MKTTKQIANKLEVSNQAIEYSESSSIYSEKISLDHFQNVKGGNGQYTALCPAHDDSNASLSIKMTHNRVLLHCFAGCSTEAIVSALGLPMTALFTDENPRKLTPKQRKVRINTITYEYKTADGSLAYKKQRYEFNDGSKSFAFFKASGEKGRGAKSYPYNLPAVLAAETIYFCEGEKCVDAINKAGRVATSLDAGANSVWKKEYNTYFEGKSIIILPDNDEPGMKYANKTALELPGSKIIKLPDLPKGGDVYDWLQQGRTMSEIDELPALEPELPQPEISINNIPDFIKINPFESSQNKQRYRWEDIGTANLFADAYKNLCRYCPEVKGWYIYDGRVWRFDVGGVVTAQCGKALTYYMLDCRKYLDDDEQRENWIKYVAKRIQKKSRDIMLADAATVYPVSIHDFDKDLYLLNVQNGTIDLRTFTLRPHSPDDFLSKIANVNFNENAKCDRWECFIQEIMQDDSDKAQFLQKALGYALTGDTSEECFFIFYGNTTRNGKGTTAETTLHILGDYGRTAQPETIAQKQHSNSGSPSEDVARLKGARFVNMSEPEKGLRLNSALVKSMTGGDTITARFLHQNSFEFRPEYKLFINTNHLPRVNDDSIFASGRVKLIPFERHFPENEQDKGLKTFFRQPENKSGILNWLLTGLKLLKSDGLKQPQSVRDATAQYRADSDVIGQFISECLVENRKFDTQLKNVHAAYEKWCDEHGHKSLNSYNLAAELRRKGKRVDRGELNKVYLISHSIISAHEDIPSE